MLNMLLRRQKRTGYSTRYTIPLATTGLDESPKHGQVHPNEPIEIQKTKKLARLCIPYYVFRIIEK